MSENKFDVGDVVRLKHGFFKENDGTLATVKSVRQTNGSFYDVLKLETVGGWILEVWEYMVEGSSLEEVHRYYAEKPRRGFIVDGLTVDETLVDELESGQDEAYQTFQRTVKNATAGEWLECAEIRAEHKRLKRKVIMELIGTVAASVGLIGGLIRIAMDGLGLTEVLPALFCAICVSVYAVSYEAGVIKGVRDEMKRIDSKILGQSSDE